MYLITQKLSKEERRTLRDAEKSSSHLDDKNSLHPGHLQVIKSLCHRHHKFSCSFKIVIDDVPSFMFVNICFSSLFVVPIRWIVF